MADTKIDFSATARSIKDVKLSLGSAEQAIQDSDPDGLAHYCSKAYVDLYMCCSKLPSDYSLTSAGAHGKK